MMGSPIEMGSFISSEIRFKHLGSKDLAEQHKCALLAEILDANNAKSILQNRGIKYKMTTDVVRGYTRLLRIWLCVTLFTDTPHTLFLCKRPFNHSVAHPSGGHRDQNC